MIYVSHKLVDKKRSEVDLPLHFSDDEVAAEEDVHPNVLPDVLHNVPNISIDTAANTSSAGSIPLSLDFVQGHITFAEQQIQFTQQTLSTAQTTILNTQKQSGYFVAYKEQFQGLLTKLIGQKRGERSASVPLPEYDVWRSPAHMKVELCANTSVAHEGDQATVGRDLMIDANINIRLPTGESSSSQPLPGDDLSILNPQQCQQLIAMLSNRMSTFSMDSHTPAQDTTHSTGTCFSVSLDSSISSSRFWIIDSGASRHICCHRHAFTSLRPFTASVILPNDMSIESCFSGDVQLSPLIVLKDVLYLLQFKFNLLSVSSLLRHTGYMVKFVDNQFIIQDTPSQGMIGKGDYLDGLYASYPAESLFNAMEVIGDRLKEEDIKKFKTSYFGQFLETNSIKFQGLLVLHLLFRQDSGLSKEKSGHTKRLDEQYIHLVDNLKEFNAYPWGRVAFENLVGDIGSCMSERVKKLWERKKAKKVHKMEKFNVSGFTHALQVWAYEVMPDLAKLCAKRVANSYDLTPRMLRRVDDENDEVKESEENDEVEESEESDEVEEIEEVEESDVSKESVGKQSGGEKTDKGDKTEKNEKTDKFEKLMGGRD
ncbi:hypothetical protein DH2020_042455 [Rehmannia glutinosa]|uniref:Retrovirus-related Pol polyprotein from transposon TNT 1-94-like beta-barrel domain-containing protein n=1 Tax=Rehmannia glutinosa TaxID=99300 RepID=A0ABR0UMV6_REHGL